MHPGQIVLDWDVLPVLFGSLIAGFLIIGRTNAGGYHLLAACRQHLRMFALS